MRAYLERIGARRFGALTDRELGPFAPGLNVVLGPNEAGKSTMASLVGAVLFGWDDRRGVANTYRPGKGERAGFLDFRVLAEDGDGLGEPHDAGSQPGHLVILSREGAGPLEGDRQLLADIDRSTYDTLFWLTSDELMSLKDSSDVTARLLAAGTGTAGSPVAALEQIQERIDRLASHDTQAQDSIAAMEQRLDDLRQRMSQEAQRQQKLRQHWWDLREQRRSQQELAQRMEALEQEVRQLADLREQLAGLNERLEALRSEGEDLQAEQEAFQREAAARSGFDERLMALDAVRERNLVGRIDELEAQWEKLQRVVETAKQNSTASAASYEAYVEMDGSAPTGNRRLMTKGSQAAVSVIPTLAFVIIGVLLFLHGRQINSLSFTAFGVALVALAFLLAAAGAVLLLRPDRTTAELESRRRDAQWVMLQDRKKLDGSLADEARLKGEIGAFLDESGLGAADGSLRQARVLLEEAARARARQAATDQRLVALGLRLDANRQEAAELEARRREALAAVLPAEEAGPQATAAVEAQLQAREAQLQALRQISADGAAHQEDLGRLLDDAADDDAFALLKLRYQQQRTALRTAKHQLIELLLARRIMERSLAAWESRSKPQVYRQAGELLSLITDGRWVGVSLASTGSIVAVDAQGRQVKPRHLSLGTCQQLYLALRVALLMASPAVGQGIPVLADDILVNFDAERRAGAARVLARLARTRQVIVLTCHRETLEALRQADPELHECPLGA